MSEMAAEVMAIPVVAPMVKVVVGIVMPMVETVADMGKPMSVERVKAAVVEHVAETAMGTAAARHGVGPSKDGYRQGRRNDGGFS
jgi:hypothetical protein